MFFRTKTLIHMLDRLRLGSGKDGELENPLGILDAGFASKANLALLKERCLGYLINITRSSRAGFAEDFAAKIERAIGRLQKSIRVSPVFTPCGMIPANRAA